MQGPDRQPFPRLEHFTIFDGKSSGWARPSPHEALETWGHQIHNKKSNTIRILLQNIGGIDTHKWGSVKLAALHEFMVENQVDVR